MTIPPNQHPEQVEITQDDRLAAIDALRGMFTSSEEADILAGRRDTLSLIRVLARHRLASLANRPADDVCDLCNGHGYWETAPGTCNPGGERIPCGKCSNITVTIGGQTWSGTAASIGTTIGSAGAKNNRPQTANRPADDGEVSADHRAHQVFDHWDKHPDAPAYWFRLPSWVQEYASACVAATERRLSQPSQPEGVKRP